MLRVFSYAKIHGATVTEANLTYVGSITIAQTLLKATGILPRERVQIVNLHNGTRVETYVLEGKAGSGTICMNGAAARWAAVGDKILIIAYGFYDLKEAQKLKQTVVFVDEKNKVRSVKKR